MSEEKSISEIKFDKTGDAIIAPNAGWSFGGDVPKHFDSHVSRSVPLYNEGHDLIAQLSDFFVGQNSTVYELGCSTARLSQKISERHTGRALRVLAVDVEAQMVAEAQERLGDNSQIEIIHSDLMALEFEPADLIVSYYTIQFIAPRSRQILFDRIYNALNWGGAFILFEKTRAPDARFQDIMTSLYTDYKLAKNYSPEEIIAKSRSLKGVLEPFSTQGNFDLLKRAGFADVMSVMKYVCFEGFLAIK